MEMKIKKRKIGGNEIKEVYIPYFLRKITEQLVEVSEDMEEAQERALEIIRQRNEESTKNLLEESDRKGGDKGYILDMELEMKETNHCMSVVLDDDAWEFLWMLKKEDLENKRKRHTYIVS